MELDDVLMLQESKSFRLPKDLFDLVRLHKSSDVHLLYGYFLTCSLVMSEVYFPKSSLAYLLLDFILSENLRIVEFLAYWLERCTFRRVVVFFFFIEGGKMKFVFLEFYSV